MQTVITNTTYENTILLLKSKYGEIAQEGCFFAIVRTEYDFKGNVLHDFLDVIAEATKIGYEYVNTIVYPSYLSHNVAISDNVKYIIWLSKKHSAMIFNKDAIREKHIWKDVEWGKRSKNYNPKGKDPGNVWIPTEDDGNGKITTHIMLDDEGVIKRLLAMSECGADYELYQSDVSMSNIVSHPNTKIFDYTISNSKVIFNTSENLDAVRDKLVKLIVTSPPYWNLKDYFKKGQIGQESYEKYLKRMEKVWAECYKKLSDDGSLWININIRKQNGRIIPIPYDFVTICKNIGFYYKGIIIWHKSSGIPTGDKNIVDRHEYVLIFSKKAEFAVDKSAFSAYSDYKNNVMVGGSFWNINRKAGSVGKKYIHPAIYPTELVKRIISVASSDEDVILDPFLGSGTTIIAAEQMNRKCIGYEFNEGFEELMHYRFNMEISESTIEFVKGTEK